MKALAPERINVPAPTLFTPPVVVDVIGELIVKVSVGLSVRTTRSAEPPVVKPAVPPMVAVLPKATKTLGVVTSAFAVNVVVPSNFKPETETVLASVTVPPEPLEVLIRFALDAVSEVADAATVTPKVVSVDQLIARTKELASYTAKSAPEPELGGLMRLKKVVAWPPAPAAPEPMRIPLAPGVTPVSVILFELPLVPPETTNKPSAPTARAASDPKVSPARVALVPKLDCTTS